MDRLVAARKLLAELVKDEQIEVRRTEIVGRDLDKYCETLGRPPTGHELEAWLEEHAQVTDVFASPTLLEELIFRYLTPPPVEHLSTADARHPELEQQIRASDAREHYTVYADWLQEQGDPMGELIALGIKATDGGEEETTRFERYLKLHEARFVPDVPRTKVTLLWRNGLVDTIEEAPLDWMTLAQWEHVLRLRVCEALRGITLRRPPTADMEALIVEHAADSFRTLTLESVGERLPPRLVQRSLRTLSVTAGKLVLTADSVPGSLERLELRVTELECVLPLRLPIRELHVAVNGFSATRLVSLLETLDLPALTHLGISDGLLDPKTFGRLGRLPLAAQLTHLALTNLELTDDMVQAMARAKTSFGALAELDVSFNELSREGLETAKTIAKTVASKRQNRRGNGAEKRVRRFAGTRLSVAEGIADPKMWKKAGVDGDVRWGRYRGEDEYELFVTADLSRYGCSCPSSIQPCKHVVALALVAERSTLPEGSSQGIEDRVARRRAEIEAAGFEDVME
ncbi:MAG: hypothetical protein M4D80_24825 [Myxococcota bacterium]|nr:hypothetical protein [Myxococcota bacterium]